MSEVTVESILERISQDHLQCAICLDTLKDPHLLRCHHTFCRSCLDNLLDDEQIKCPTCRKTTPMKRNNTHQLEKNFSLASLVDDVEKEKKRLQEQDGVLMCSDCSDESNAKIKCVDCDESFCQDCWFNPGTIHTDHLVKVLNHVEKVPQCDQHQDQNISFYCTTCRVMICAMCAAIDHRGQDHDYVPLDEAESIATQQLLKILSKCEERHQEIIMERSLVDGERYMVENMIFNMIRSIKQTKLHANTVIYHLQEFKKARELDYTNALSTADAIIEMIKHVCAEISNGATEANKYNLLKQMDHLVTTAEAAINETLTFPKLLSAKLCISKSDKFAQVSIKKKDSNTDKFGQDTKGLFYDIKVLGYK